MDLLLNIDTDGRINTKINDKCDDFRFPIVNFPFLGSNIPATPEYGVFVSQLLYITEGSVLVLVTFGWCKLLTEKYSDMNIRKLKDPRRT